jgi:hypothetical protein
MRTLSKSSDAPTVIPIWPGTLTSLRESLGVI